MADCEQLAGDYACSNSCLRRYQLSMNDGTSWKEWTSSEKNSENGAVSQPLSRLLPPMSNVSCACFLFGLAQPQ